MQIDLDIPRTLPSHTLFVTRYGKGQRMLFEVLHERSNACKFLSIDDAQVLISRTGDECGYCQGMAGIAAICLTYGASSLLATLHGSSDSFSNGAAHYEEKPAHSLPQSDKFALHDMLRSGFPGLQVLFERQEALCKKHMPKIHAILVRICIA